MELESLETRVSSRVKLKRKPPKPSRMQHRKQQLAAAKRKLQKFQQSRTSASSYPIAAGGHTPTEGGIEYQLSLPDSRVSAELERRLESVEKNVANVVPLNSLPDSNSAKHSVQAARAVSPSRITSQLSSGSDESSEKINSLSHQALELEQPKEADRSLSDSRLDQMQEMISHLKKDLSERTELFDKQNQAESDAKLKIEELEGLVKSTLSEKLLLENLRAEQQNVILKLQGELDSISASRSEQERDSLQKQIAELREALDRQRTEQKNLVLQFESERAHELDDLRANFSVPFADRDGEFASLRTQLDETLSENERLASQLQAALEEAERLRASPTMSDKAWAESEGDIRKLKDQMNLLTEQSRLLQLEVQEERSKLHEKEALLEAAKIGRYTMSQGVADETDRLETLLVDVRAQHDNDVKELSEKLTAADRSLQDASEKASANQARCEDLDREREELSNLVNSVRDRIQFMLLHRSSVSRAAETQVAEDESLEGLLDALQSAYSQDAAYFCKTQEDAKISEDSDARPGADSESAALRSELEESRERENNLSEQVGKLGSAALDFSDKIASLDEECSLLQSKLLELESRNSELSTQLLEARELKTDRARIDDDLKTEIISLESALKDLTIENESLKSLREQIVEDSQVKLQALLTEKEELEAQNSKLHEAGATVMDSVQKLEEENDAVIAANGILAAEKESIQLELEQLRQAHQTDMDELDCLREDNERMREAGIAVLEARAALEEANESLQAEITALREAGSAIVDDRDSLETQFAERSRELEELQEELSVLRSSLSEKNEQNEALRSELKTIVDKSSGDLQELVDSLRNLTEANSDLKEELKGASQVIEELRGLRNADMSSLEEHAHKIESMKFELEASNADLLSVEQEFATYREEVRKKIEDKERKIELMNIELDNHRNELASIEHEFATHREDTQAVFEERDSLNETIEGLRRGDDELQQKLRIYSEDIDILHRQLAESEQRYDNLLEAGEAHSNDLETRIQNLENERESTNRHLQDLEAEKSVLLQQLNSFDKQFEDIDALTAENHSLSEQLALTREQTMHFESELANLHQVLDEKDTAINNLNEELNRFRNLNDDLQKLSDEFHEASLAKERLQHNLHSLEEMLDESQNKVASLERERDAALGDYQSSIERQTLLEEEQAILNKRTIELRDEISTLQQELDSLEQFRISNLEEHENRLQEFNYLQEEANAMRAEAGKHSAITTRLQEEADWYRNESSSLSSKLRSEEEQREALIQEMEMVNSLVKQLTDENSYLSNKLEKQSDLAAVSAERVPILEKELAARSAELGGLKEQLCRTESDLKAANDMVSTVMNQLRESESMFQDTSDRLAIAEEKLDSSLVERDRYQSELNQICMRVDSLEADLKRIRFEKDSAEGRLNDALLLEDELYSRLSMLESERDSLLVAIDEKTSTFETLSQHASKLEEEVETLKQKDAASTIFSSSDQSSTETADVLFSNMYNTNQQNGNVVRGNEPIKALELEIAVKLEEISVLKERLNEAEERVANYSRVSESSVQSMELYREELMKTTKKLELVEKEISDLKNNRSVLKAVGGNSILDLPDLQEVEVNLSKTGEAAVNFDQLLKSAVLRLAQLKGPPTTASQADDSDKNEKLEILELVKAQISSIIEFARGNVDLANKLLSSSTNSDAKVDVKGLDLIAKAQEQLLNEHRKLLSELDSMTLLIQQDGRLINSDIHARMSSFRKESRGSSPFLDLGSLMSHFLSSIKHYEAVVSGLVNKIGNSAPRGFAESMPVTQDGFKEIVNHHKLLSKQVKYLTSLVTRYIPSQEVEEVERSVEYDSASPSIQGLGTNDANDRRLTSTDYSDLITKASQSERFAKQLENAMTLQTEHIKEIQVLKEAVSALSYHHDQFKEQRSPDSESQSYRLLQRQVDELKRVWSHELSANTILRNLIAKIQADNMVIEDEARRQQMCLRQEFDELVALFNETNQNASLLRDDVAQRDQILNEVEQRMEERLNAQFFELERQHQDQTQQLEDMYDKERSALNKLVSNLEQERNRLQSDLSTIKVSLGEKLAEAIRFADEVQSRLRESERVKAEIQQELLFAQDTIQRHMSNGSDRGDYFVGKENRNLLDEIKRIEMRLHAREAELANERRLSDRRIVERDEYWVAQLKAQEEELLRESGRSIDSNSRIDQAARMFRTDKGNLEKMIAERDKQLHVLEIRIQELLRSEGDLVPVSEMRHREAELDRMYQDQIRQLHSQLSSIDEARKLMEGQFLFEKDKNRKLSNRAEEYKRKYLQQRLVLQQQDESINSALRPGSRGTSAEEEVALLRRELLQAKRNSSEVVGIIRETLINTMGQASIDVEDSRSSKIKVDMMRLRDEMRALISEVTYLRAFVNRLLLWRADLKYQKLYLSLKVEDLLSSQKVTLAFIRGMGVNAPIANSDDVLTPVQKFKRCANVVIGVYRMMCLASSWRDVIIDNEAREFFTGMNLEAKHHYRKRGQIQQDESSNTSSYRNSFSEGRGITTSPQWIVPPY